VVGHLPFALVPFLEPFRVPRTFEASFHAQLVLELLFPHFLARDLHVEVYLGRVLEAKGVSNLQQVQLVHIEDVPQLVRGVTLHVRLVGITTRGVEVVVLLDELHEGLLDVGKLAHWELVLIRLDLRLSQVPQEPKLML